MNGDPMEMPNKMAKLIEGILVRHGFSDVRVGVQLSGLPHPAGGPAWWVNATFVPAPELDAHPDDLSNSDSDIDREFAALMGGLAADEAAEQVALEEKKRQRVEKNRRNLAEMAAELHDGGDDDEADPDGEAG